MQDIVLSPSDFVALVNQTLEFAYPTVVIEGELVDFRISKNRWVYFSLKDDESAVKFFGTVYQMPGPLQDGMMIRVIGTPRLHPKFGFSVNAQSISPVGKGAIKKAADLLRAKLEAEGLFAVERKRPLPQYPSRVGLVTAGNSAAYADFIKITNERWGGVEIVFADVYVQGEQAPGLIIQAIEGFNMLSNPPELIAIVRGGGSAEDLAAFNDERVVRAVAASRISTVVGVGHEVDESLAELVADLRASTPSNAAQLIFPDKKHELANLKVLGKNLANEVVGIHESSIESLASSADYINRSIKNIFELESSKLENTKRLAELFNPASALRRGYAIVKKGNQYLSSATQVVEGDRLSIELRDGKIYVLVDK